MEIHGTKKKRCKANNDVQDHHEKVAIPKEGRLIPPKRLSRNKHDKNFQIPSAASDYRKYSFFPRTIRDWNALPPHGVVTAPSVEAFKASLIKLNYNSYILGGGGGGSVCAPKSWHYNQLDNCGHYQAETETETTDVVRLL